MKRIWLGGLLIAALMLASCAVEPTEKPVEPVMAPVEPIELGNLPDNALGVFQGTIKYGVPPHILKAGDTVDTWTELDETPVLGHKIGDPISLKIWNGYASDVGVNVFWVPSDSYFSRVPDTDICKDSDGEYVIAPDYVRGWFIFKTGVYTIPSRTVLDIPLYLYIPKDTTLEGRYILQVAIVKVPDAPVPMGLVEAYVFKLKMEIE